MLYSIRASRSLNFLSFCSKQQLYFAHNETPDGVAGTKGAYDAEIAGGQRVWIEGRATLTG